MRMINEANASSSACRLWRVHMVETSAPPAQFSKAIILQLALRVKSTSHRINRSHAADFQIVVAPLDQWEIQGEDQSKHDAG